MWEKLRVPKLACLTIFCIAFGYIEAAVVVYLRQSYYPDGFQIPFELFFPHIKFGTTPFLQTIPLNILFTEVGRKTATIVILFTKHQLLARILNPGFCNREWNSPKNMRIFYGIKSLVHTQRYALHFFTCKNTHLFRLGYHFC